LIEPAEPREQAKQHGSASATSAPGPNGDLKLADGIELIGEYQGSGFKEPPYIARRADGQMIQLPKLLFLIAKQVDGRRDANQVATEVTREFGRGVSGENVAFLADKKLRPLGVLAAADGSSPKLEKPDPMLALKFRAALIPRGVVNGFTTVFHPLFWPIVVLAALAGLVALDAWLFFFHGVAQSVRNLINEPVFFLLVFALVVLSAAFHECGHATGLRYGGGKPGVMGAGLYMVWPAFYTDVTDSYRLSKGARLRTDLGGVYLNVNLMLLTVGA
jgi:putative peptide zinc metalloprotease protein